VIVHGYVRPTEDLDVLVPHGPGTGASLRTLLEDWGGTRPDGSALPEALFDGNHNVRALPPTESWISYRREHRRSISKACWRALAPPLLRIGLVSLSAEAGLG